MPKVKSDVINLKYSIAIISIVLFISSCKITKSVPEGNYLLRKNKLVLTSDRSITNKGVLEDQLNLLIAPKTNTYWSNIIPVKLIKYNWRFQKIDKDPLLELPKGLERPVLYDSAIQNRSVQNLQNFLINQGYFRANVSGNARFHNKKATANFRVNTGTVFLIDKIITQINSDTLSQLLVNSKSLMRKGAAYTKSLIDEERARIISLMQNNGYYKFSQENVRFELDTFNKETLRENENIFESAINFVALQSKRKRLTVDVKIIIDDTFDKTAYTKYQIGRVVVFPDFIDRVISVRDSNMVVKVMDSIKYRYHNYYVKESVLNRAIFIRPQSVYSRADHELTLNKLNELGIFQMVNVYFVEDTSQKDKHLMNCFITMSPTKMKDNSGSLEMANSVAYWLGNSAGITYRNKNFFKQANLFSISASGGVELNYIDTIGKTFKDHLQLQSTNFSISSSILFPKFLSPYKPEWINIRNMPKTKLNLGISVLDRLNMFRLTNIYSSFTYNWNQSNTQIWELTPAFANIILPKIWSNFQPRLDSNSFLRNTYRRTFIEGEQISYTFSDQIKKENRNYNYINVSFEEAGILMSAMDNIQKSITKNNGFIYDQYIKFDLDARRYINARHSLVALRLLAGIGLPYGSSKTLPYIKQYYAGGPYSVRGWRPRTLGPINVTSKDTINVDRTGDIKLEANVEYRFEVIQLFSGVLKLNGAVFADAGNVWLAKKDSQSPNGHFDISRLGKDIAISTGFGMRVIVADFFTIRLDFGFPVKNPYITTNNGWVINDIQFNDPSWRSKNLVTNFAIGMPF